MRTLFSVAPALVASLLACATWSSAAQAQDKPLTNAQIEAAASSSSTVDLNQDRKPSFYTRGRHGTEVVEFRDRGKAPEINVHSGLGTNYHMTQPMDYSPKIRDNDAQDGRVPSIGIRF